MGVEAQGTGRLEYIRRRFTAMMNWCSKHQLFEVCPECIREVREAKEQREWCLRMAKREGDAEITAGVSESDANSPPQRENE
jgi:hypothetical protein